MYPYADPERVPIPLAMAIVCLGPAAVIAIYTMVIDGLFATGGGSFKKYSFKSRLWELNCGILGLLLGVGTSFVITAALKNAIGKPRPDIIARCAMPTDVAAPYLLPGNFSLVTYELCSKDVEHHILKDGFRSFPSGHSSSEYSYKLFSTRGKINSINRCLGRPLLPLPLPHRQIAPPRFPRRSLENFRSPGTIDRRSSYSRIPHNGRSTPSVRRYNG